MYRRIVSSIVMLLVCTGASFGQASPDQRCSRSVVESDPAEALSACNLVLERDDLTDAARAAALKIRGRALNKADRLDEGSASFDQALRLAPDDAELHMRRGWSALENHDLGLATSHAQQALKIDPSYAAAFDLVGAIYAEESREEKFTEAKAAYDQAVKLDPVDPQPRYHIYQLFQGRSPRDELREIEGLLQLPASAINKPSPTLYYVRHTSYRIAASLIRARLLWQLGRINEAVQAFDQAVAIDPDVLTYACRAEFHLQTSAAEEVVQADLDKALTLDPDFWFVRDVQARVHFYSGRYDAAAADFARALKQRPVNGYLHWWQARTLRKLGRGDEASSEAITALEVDPHFLFSKVGMLQQRGYLPKLAPDSDPRPALEDAARACMLDQDCG